MKKPLVTAFLTILSLLLLSCSGDNRATGLDSDGSLYRLGYSSPINWTETDQVFDQAYTLDKKVMIFFTSDDCNWGDSLEINTFSDYNAFTFVNRNFIPVYINTSSEFRHKFYDTTLTGNEIFKNVYNLVGVPSFLILDKSRQYEGRLRGYSEAVEFIDELQTFVSSPTN